MTIQVREAVESDREAIADVLLAAFGGAEGREIVALVDDLSRDPTARPLLSLVAAADDRIIGYILFTHTRIEHARKTASSAILAPLAVHPDWQSQGVGGRLIMEGLKRLAAAGVDLVFVLGHPGYYPRCGFSPAGEKGFDAPHPIPPENTDAWMVLELRSGVIGHEAGRVVCADALQDPRYWLE